MPVSSSHGGRSGSRAVPGCQPTVCQAVLRHLLPAKSHLRTDGQQPEGDVGHQQVPRPDDGGRERGPFRPGAGHPGQPADGEVCLQPHEAPQLHNEGRPHESFHVPTEEWSG